MLIKAAKYYIKQRISCIAVDANKRAVMRWKEYQERLPTEDEIEAMFSHPKAVGIALICGPVSGNLEVVDFDLKNDINTGIYDRFMARVRELNASVAESLHIVSTRSGGFHHYHRSEVIEGNQKLAMRAATPQELTDNPQLKEVVLIETRGNGGYVVAPPSDGYARLDPKKPVPVLTADERDLLLSIAREMNEVYTAPPVENRTDVKSYGKTPWEDFNERGDVIYTLEKHGWTIAGHRGERIDLKRPGKTDSPCGGNFHTTKRTFYVFTTNSVFEPGRAYSPMAVYAILEHRGDFRAAAKALLDQGFGEKRPQYGKLESELTKRKAEGMSDEDLAVFLIKNREKTVEEAKKIITSLNNTWGDKISTFWRVDNKGRISVIRHLLMDFLTTTGGFYIYYYGASKIYRLVRVQAGMVEEVTAEDIKAFVKDYIMSLPNTFDGGITPPDLYEIVLKGADTFFSKGLMDFLDTAQLDFLKDTPTTAYYPFLNGVVVVTPGDISLVSYGAIKKHVWKSKVIQHEITVDKDLSYNDVEFYKFLFNISGQEEERIIYALQLMGYLIHGHKDMGRPWAVILAEETDSEEKGGGTGKGIYARAVGAMARMEMMDGKNFKTDKSFAWQRVSLDTQIVFIDDVKKNVDFEAFYSTITTGITVEKKNKDELYIPYEDSPKFLFATNYTIKSTGEHAKRRQKVLEFASHYSSTHSPVDEFGHRLFDDWDKDEWNRFYNLMFDAIQLYMKEGVVPVEQSMKIKRKYLKTHYGEEFLDWLDLYLENGCRDWKELSQEYQIMLDGAGLDKKDYSIKRFRSAIDSVSAVFGTVIEIRKNSSKNGKREMRIKNIPENPF
jgi:Bifunctional DNA primase/polymerase, N-terminal